MPIQAVSAQWEILVVALVLGAAHIISPAIFKRREDPARQRAFAGGLSVAYVFLHLIPSIDVSQRVVGARIYFVALLGFVLFYALDVRYQPPRHRHPTKYHAYLVAFFLYDGLLVFTLGLNLPPTPLLTLVFAVAVALDVLATDLELQELYGTRFVRFGRWVLFGGVTFGYTLNLFRRPNRLAVDILTAALAGFMMFHTFNDQLSSKKGRFPAFAAGVAAFCFLHIVLGAAE
jgi:Ca2+/Na+ antiporter